MKKRLLLIMFLTLAIGVSPTFSAPFQAAGETQDQEGKKMSFQGTLYENGIPVDGERSFTFSIDLGNDETWTETQANVQVIQGLYAVTLGSVTPLPENLFFDVTERILTVSIGNNVLGSTPLYAPFSVSDGQNFGQGDFKLETMSEADSVALNGEIYGIGNNGEFAAGVKGFAHTDTTANTGVAGVASGGDLNFANQTGVRGNAYSNTYGSWTTGVWGVGNAMAGSIAYGIRGEARGNGGTFSAGMRGLNFVEPDNDGTRYGGYFNTYSSTSGENIIGESIGVRGSATGSLTNVGIWGSATGEGSDNWAGRFDGNVGVRDGELMMSRDQQSFARIWRNDQGAGSLELKSAVDSVSVLVDSNGDKAGLILLNDSLGRESMGLYAYSGNNAQLRMSSGIPETGETAVTAQFVGSLNPYVNLIARNEDGTANSRAQMGRLAGFNGSGFRVTDGNFRWLATMQGDDQDGGSITLEGPSSSNFWIGQKNWEDSNLPFMGMRGAYSEGEGDGAYNPDLLQLEVNRDFDNGVEFGQINIGKTTENGVEMLSLNYDELNNLLNPFSYIVRGENGNDVARLERRGDNFGQAQFFNDNNELRAEIGSFGDNSGFMQLYAPNGNKNLQLGGTDDARDYGMLKLFDANGQDMFQLQTEDNNGNQVPFFRMGNTQNLDENNYPKDAIRAGLSSDPNGDGKYSTYFNLEGPDAPLIHMGAHGYDANDGSNRARIALFGGDMIDDGNGGFYTPERVNISVAKDGGNTEFGTFNLSNSAGGGFEIGSRGWENGDQGGNLTYTAILSTIDVDDGNGGTYRPWLVTQELHEDGNGNEYGTLGINSTNNAGFVSLNPGNSGNIDISGSLNQSSDARLKKNVSTLTSGLSLVNRLRGVRYNWKDETRTENKIGFIAQEVEQVLPELVKTRENGFKGVNYSEMTAVLVEAVKELSAQVEALKSENTELKAEASKVEAMEERLAKIEALLLNNSKKVNADQKQ